MGLSGVHRLLVGDAVEVPGPGKESNRDFEAVKSSGRCYCRQTVGEVNEACSRPRVLGSHQGWIIISAHFEESNGDVRHRDVGLGV